MNLLCLLHSYERDQELLPSVLFGLLKLWSFCLRPVDTTFISLVITCKQVLGRVLLTQTQEKSLEESDTVSWACREEVVTLLHRLSYYPICDAQQPKPLL